MIQLKFLPSFLTAVALLGAGSAAVARDMVAIDRPEVNMRSGAGTQHEALWVLSRGYPLEVLKRQGKWLEVRDFENDKGWVYKSLTSTRKPHHVVKVNNLNIRSAPSMKGRIVSTAVKGEILTSKGRKGNWVKVEQEGGKTGWVVSRLVWGW